MEIRFDSPIVNLALRADEVCGRPWLRLASAPSEASGVAASAPAWRVGSGQVVIDAMSLVEGTKGNNGEKGMLLITNLRLIWRCQRNSKINLSIGYGAVIGLNLNILSANSRPRVAAARVPVWRGAGGCGGVHAAPFIHRHLDLQRQRLSGAKMHIYIM